MSTTSTSPASSASSSPTPSRPPTPSPFIDPNSAPSSPPLPIKPVAIDPRGDLTLLIGTALTDASPASIRVCSLTLRRTSPVFAAMLFGGPWLESRPSNGREWVVELPEDNAVAMEALLGAAHGKFRFVPKEIVQLAEFAIASDVLVVAEKYQMMEVLEPFTEAWLGTLGALNGSWKGMDVLQRANVAWGFAEPGAMNFVVKTAVWEMERKAVAELREVAGRATDLGMPSSLTDILGPIGRFRLELIQEILDFFQDRIVAPRSSPPTRPVATIEGGCRRAPPGSRQGRGCNRWTVDRIASYDKLEFVTKRRAADVDCSAEHLLKGMKAMFHWIGSGYFPGHKMCCPLKEVEEFEDALERTWVSGWMEELIEDRHFVDMRRRQAGMEYSTPFSTGHHRFRYLL